MSAPLLEIEDLSTWIESGDATVRAVDGLSLSISRGETYALLGESGCGKSVTALSVMRLLPDAGRVVAGQVKLDGRDLLQLPETQMRDVRGGRIGMIFQEPMLSLNPVLSVGAQIGEVLERHLDLKGDAVTSKARELLDAVGVPDAARRLGEYPFQLSGGLRQRVMIAMALACEPELLIADEPTTALDVTIQAQVLELLRDLQRRRGMAMLLITHDLGVVAETAHRVGVMYAGQIVESAPCETFFADPKHPYSRKLFASMPTQRKRGETLAVIGGTVPSLAREFTGCRFADRCDQALDHCASQIPDLIAHTPSQHIRCHLFLQQNGVRSGLLHTAPQPQEVEQNGVRSPLLQPEVHLQRDRQDRARFQHDQANSKTLRPEMQRARPDPSSGRPDSGLAEVQQARPDPNAVAGGLLAVSDLRVHFPIQRGILRRVVGYVRAVDGVSLSIPAGRTLALVGESGCGKTTVGKAVLQLLRPTGGEVLFDGQDLAQLGAAQLRAQRRAFQIVFQDPYSSLNPRMRVAEIIEEGMAALGVGATPAERAARIDALLGEVGLDHSARSRYPHEFSGGQRQRIAVARALAVEPRLIICDEPTSALDVSVQAQILNLLLDLQRRRGIAYLFITHNMGVVQFLAHEVAVMYLGRVVEQGSVDEVFGAPKHPYTQALLSAVPVPDPQARRDVLRIPGDLPSPVTPPSGCHFHPRCPKASDACRATFPTERIVAGTHRVRCHLYD